MIWQLWLLKCRWLLFPFQRSEKLNSPNFSLSLNKSLTAAPRVFPEWEACILHHMGQLYLQSQPLHGEITGDFTRPLWEKHLPAHVSLEEWAEKPGTQLERQRPLFRKKPWSQRSHLSLWLHRKHPLGQAIKDRTHQVRRDEGTGTQQGPPVTKKWGGKAQQHTTPGCSRREFGIACRIS